MNRIDWNLKPFKTWRGVESWKRQQKHKVGPCSVIVISTRKTAETWLATEYMDSDLCRNLEKRLAEAL